MKGSIYTVDFPDATYLTELNVLPWQDMSKSDPSIVANSRNSLKLARVVAMKQNISSSYTFLYRCQTHIKPKMEVGRLIGD